MTYKKKTILITGAAGFIGSNLCRRLLSDNHFVIGLDNFVTGSHKNIEAFKDNPNFSFIEHDLENPLTIVEPIDEIFHLASIASPYHYQKQPIKTLKTNTIGIYNILDLALKHRAKIFQASTSEIYGDPKVHPQKESYLGNVDTIGPRACYNESKRIAETLFFEYHKTYGLDIRIGRIFNTYGPQMDSSDGRVIPNFIIQCLNQKPMTIYGSGNQTRSFCYIDDLIEGILELMKKESFFPMPINLGNDLEISLNDLAKMIQDLTKSDSPILHLNKTLQDPQRRKPDLTLAKTHLNWNFSTWLKEGLIQTIHYFKSIAKD
ncbi:MAG TPA: SDR family oxidoreductase [Chlamydiales bacterium]|nr:SDR family oxidoreductase [Chlamydiales bacterium]